MTTATTVNSISLHGISLSVKGFSLGRLVVRNGQVWAQVLDVPQGVERFTLEVITGLTVDEHTLIFHGGAPLDQGDYQFDVPVDWTSGHPRTRQVGIDNCDVQKITTNGKVIDVQASIVSRGEAFYACLQQLVVGQVGRTIGGKRDFVPTDSVHAYPGFDFSKTFANMNDGLMRFVNQEKASVQKSRIEAAEWQPEVLEPRAGWSRGVVRYWNMVTGLGHVEDIETHEVFFVHFSKILDPQTLNSPAKITFTALEPMKGVYFKPGTLPPGKVNREVKSVFQPAKS